MNKHSRTPLSIYLDSLPEHFQVIANLLVSNLPRFWGEATDLPLICEPVRLWGSELQPEEQQSLISILAAVYLSERHEQQDMGLPLNKLEYLFKIQLQANNDASTLAEKLLPIARELITSKRPTLFFGEQAEIVNHFLIIRDNIIYRAKDYQCYLDVAKLLKVLYEKQNNNGAMYQEKLAAVKTKPAYNNDSPMLLTAKQDEAVIKTLSNYFSILAGGPGSGKTAVIATILRTARRSGWQAHEIALAAPTGKAANRIAESVEANLNSIKEPDDIDSDLLQLLPKAQTLHHLLAYHPEAGFRHNKDNPLNAKLLIVDEASMIDTYMLRQLLLALGPDTQLLLVGDPNQLPPVGGINMLAKLCAKLQNTKFCTVLDSSFRMSGRDLGGRNIAILAKNIIESQNDLLEYNKPPSLAKIGDSGIDLVESDKVTKTDLKAFLRKLLAKQYDEINKYFKKVFLFNENGFSQEDCKILKEIQKQLTSSLILSPLNDGELGVNSLNTLAHYVHLDLTMTSGDLAAGEVIICTKNDYFHNIFNGDIGFMVPVKSGGLPPELMAVFPREGIFIPFPLESVKNHISLAHALTVHKAQGSEANELFLILPDRGKDMLSRELLYTAVTRAKHHVVICCHQPEKLFALKKEAAPQKGQQLEFDY